MGVSRSFEMLPILKNLFLSRKRILVHKLIQHALALVLCVFGGGRSSSIGDLFHDFIAMIDEVPHAPQKEDERDDAENTAE